MLLREIVAKNHFNFIESAADWQESIRLACGPLVADGTVTDGYAEEIIECVKKYGPYIAIMPGFALPHSMENSACAAGTAVSFMKVEQPVSFDAADSEKSATVFFTLSAVDSEEHLANMKRLFKMLTNEDLCADLLKVRTREDLLLLAEKYGAGGQ